jgi:hypothetical protein
MIRGGFGGSPLIYVVRLSEEIIILIGEQFSAQRWLYVRA